jgi:hypothetical protein
MRSMVLGMSAGLMPTLQATMVVDGQIFLSGLMCDCCWLLQT